MVCSSCLPAGALAWNGEQLSSGSRDRVILQRDVRTPPSAERRLQGHRQEVCGLKWSPDHQHLASGGNDNKVRQLYQQRKTGSSRKADGSEALPSAVTGVEQLQPPARAAVQRPPRRRQSHRLVSPPARAAGVGRRHGRPLPALLEHADGSGSAEHRHRVSGVQPGLVQTRQRTGEATSQSQVLFHMFTPHLLKK